MDTGIRISELGADEKQRSRALWESCFSEDSRRFVDYYYEEKCRDNRILGLEVSAADEEILTVQEAAETKASAQEAAGEESTYRLLSMVQLNPYLVRLKGSICPLDYIVGVATDAGARHRGYMRRLLMGMLKDMEADRVPFTFLMPADPAIYAPFGFAYCYDQPSWKLTAEADRRLVREPLNLKGGLDHRAEEGRVWLNHWLETHFEVYAVRDRRYMERLAKELLSEDGEWNLLYDCGEADGGSEADADLEGRFRRLVGMEAFWGIGHREQRFLYAEDIYIEEKLPAKPAIMMRLVCLEELVKALRLGQGDAAEDGANDRSAATSGLEFCLGILDGQLPANNGCFKLTVTKEGTKVEKLSDVIGKGTWTLTAEELMQWVMGYRKPDGPAAILAQIETVRGVFLDEVV